MFSSNWSALITLSKSTARPPSKISNHVGGRLAKDHLRADCGLRRSTDRRARYGNIDQLDHVLAVAVDFQYRVAEMRHDAFVTPVLRHAEGVAVDEPGKLIGNLLPLCVGKAELHRETALRVARDLAFDAADLVEIGHDPLADLAPHRRDERYAARRHVDCLAGEFALVLEHVAAEKRDRDALVPTPL